jgi:hypothetical protein
LIGVTLQRTPRRLVSEIGLGVFGLGFKIVRPAAMPALYADGRPAERRLIVSGFLKVRVFLNTVQKLDHEFNQLPPVFHYSLAPSLF